jgi:type IV secretion/conjugal transfer VirB4 family ATPase
MDSATEAVRGLWDEYWRKPPRVSRVADMFPLLAVLDDNKTCITKNGDLVRVIELQGRDYSGMADALGNNLYSLRKQFFESSPSGIVLTIHSLRHRVSHEVHEGDYGDPVLTGLLARWGAQFRETYRNRHVLVVRTSRGSMFGELLSKALKRGDGVDADLMERLDNAVNQFLLKLEDYRPRVLEHRPEKSELLSYWAWLVNGRPVNFTTDHFVFDDLIAGVDLHWPAGKNHQEFIGGEKRYSAWLTIKMYPNEASGAMLDQLYRLSRDFSLHQSFQFMEKRAAIQFVDDWMRHTVAFTKSGQIIRLELQEVMDRLEADDIKLCEHAFGLQVFANSEAELARAVQEIKNAIESRGVTVVRESDNQEALFWSIFPSHEHMNVRGRHITSENAAGFVTFSSIGEGLDRCSFGDEPVTMFRTLTGSDYSFTFHASPEPFAPGHTVIVGDTGVGKTTAISFLVANCLRYQNFRAVLFDRLHGMAVATQLLGGEYEDFSKASQVNPLQLPDNKENRAFLAQWFELLTGHGDDAAKEEINLAIDQAYRLDPLDRRLSEIVSAFGLKRKGSLREGLEKWLPEGQYGHFFNGKRDALSFDKQLVGFDMTTILDIPEVLGAMVSYLFHRLTAAVLANPGPYVVFFDEMNKYLDTSFGPKIRNAAQEIRKTNGVLIGAVQQPGVLLNNEYGRAVLDSCATYVLYPFPTGEKDEYVKGLGLTDAEFRWIKEASKRQVMIKRRGGESTVVNVDLAPLGKYLKVFDSASTSVAALSKLRAKGGEWRHAYLAK